MVAQFTYDYYNVSVPGDLYEGSELSDSEQLAQLADCAIDQARENAKLYCIPADWRADHIKGWPGDFEVKFRVRRRRFKPTPQRRFKLKK